MAHLKKSILIHAPVEQVYALARDPRRWATFWVGLGEPEELTGQGEVGTVVKHSYLMAGMRFPVTTRVLKDHVSPAGAQWKGKIEGPLAGEHTWVYTPKEGGTGPHRRPLDHRAYAGTLPGTDAGELEAAVRRGYSVIQTAGEPGRGLAPPALRSKVNWQRSKPNGR